MDNSLKTKKKPPKRGANSPRKRQNQNLRLPPMPDILDTERPVDRHVRNPAQSSATGKHHRIPFDARAPRHQCPDNPERRPEPGGGMDRACLSP